MKAIVQERFGTPDVLRLVEVDRPEPGPDDVVVRVAAAGLNPYDWHMVRGDPLVARLMGGMGLRKPAARVAGVDVAGEVTAVGANVSQLRPGDAVLGFCAGALAEYARAKADRVVPKPARLSFEQAAAVPMAALTALQGLRDFGAVRIGHRVLINGAAGGVARTGCRSRPRWALRSPACAAPATSSWSARSAPRTSSTTRPRTSPTAGCGTTCCWTTSAT